MKKILIVIGILVTFVSQAQILKPAQWSFDTSKKEVKAGEQIDLIFHTTIDKDWYLYSSDFDPDLGPMLTTFAFKPNDTYQLVGKIQPVKPKKKYDKTWEGEYTYFIEKAEFRQAVKILKANPKIEGEIEYQVCSEVDGKCIPNTESFSFTQIKVLAQAEVTALPADQANESLLGFMVVAFLTGLAALLTPCVFPMIPMTVTFFTSHSGSRRKAITQALVYGFSIIALYILIGTVVSLINGPGFANFLSTHWAPNIFFFLAFIFFALSFLGMFDLNIPGSVITKVDAQADRGGYIGVFFMAFTIVLVSFSCTGPLVGSILIASAGGEVIKPVLGMFAFSLAFALPFSLFAIFPDWLKSLPKSGGWLNSVKVVLGFLELALALKFLSIADQVYHWELLNRDVFLALWIVIFSLIGFYLLGKIRLPSDDSMDKVSVPRVMLAILTFAFVVYLVPGMFGAPLYNLAGYLPPQTTQEFDLNKPQTGLLVSNSARSVPADQPKYADLFKLPHGLNGFFDYKEGLAYAKKVNKPVFIDFTGHGCVNCRAMEARVWSNPGVLRRLANDYVIVSLYVDDKHELPESEWYTSTYDGKIKTTIGAQNFDYQVSKFNYNAQPLYVLLDPEGNPLPVKPITYDIDASHFVTFLEKGKSEYKNSTKGYVQMPVSTVGQ